MLPGEPTPTVFPTVSVDQTLAAAQTPAATVLPPPATGAPPSPLPATPTGAANAEPLATQTPSLLSGHIVFTCYIAGYDNICLMRADGSDQRRLTDTQATDFYASLAADGTQVVFSSRRTGNFEIFRMAADGSDVVQLTEGLGSNFGPALSPDGRQIVFASVQQGFAHIWVMDADGANSRQLTFQGSNMDPEWSPDGRQIAFASDRGGTTELYVMDADGGNVRQVTNGLQVGGRSDWSADSAELTFYAGPANRRHIFVIDLLDPGAALRQLTTTSDNRGPTYSPDGRWIAFTSIRDGDNEIYAIPAEGGELLQLTNNTRPDWQPRWGP